MPSVAYLRTRKREVTEINTVVESATCHPLIGLDPIKDNVSIKINIISTVRLLESRRILVGFFFLGQITSRTKWMCLCSNEMWKDFRLTCQGKQFLHLGIRSTLVLFQPSHSVQIRMWDSGPIPGFICYTHEKTTKRMQSWSFLCLRKHGREGRGCDVWTYGYILHDGIHHGGEALVVVQVPCLVNHLSIPYLPSQPMSWKHPCKSGFLCIFNTEKRLLHLSGWVNSVEGCKHTWWRFALRLYQCTMIVFPPKSEVKPTCKGYTRQPEKGKHNCNLEHICNMKSTYSFIEIILSGMHWCKWITANI
jgi:hypothetical protein